MSRALILAYGVTGYAVFFATFLYLIGFVSGFVVPITMDSGGRIGSLGTAILIDTALVALFAIQHTVMARPGFKQAIARFVPPSIERTTFMVATCAVLALTFVAWRPIGGVLWSVDGTLAWILHGIAFSGWSLVLLSTFLIDHFDLFGLRQTWFAFRGRPYTQKPFVERSAYRFVRHPLMLGMLIAFWATPTMTIGHLVFAASYTLYVLFGVFIEERDLVAAHGDAYREYQRRVPKLLPIGSKRRRDMSASVATS